MVALNALNPTLDYAGTRSLSKVEYGQALINSEDFICSTSFIGFIVPAQVSAGTVPYHAMLLAAVFLKIEV